jgi:DNA repair protein SbcC/Rad50
VRLRRLSIDRLPGLRRGFELDELSPGLNIIIGPNGSGKSSLCRAVRALLWGEEPFRGAVSSEWEHGDGRLEIERESGTPPRSTLLTGDLAAPTLPDARFARCFTLSIDDFLTDRHTEDVISLEIRKELAAGFDLSAILADSRGRSVMSGGAVQKAATLREAERDKREVKKEHRDLAQEERGLAELRAERERAAEALRSATRCSAAVELAEARIAAREAVARSQAFPPGVRRLRGDEEERQLELRASIEESESDLERALHDASAATAALERAALESPVPSEDLETLAAREERLRSLERDLERAREAEVSAIGALTEANRSLRHTPVADSPPELEETSWPAIESALAACESRAAQLTALRAELELSENPEDDRVEPPINKGMHALARWLEEGNSADPLTNHGIPPAIGAGVLLLVAGAGGLILGSVFSWLLIIAGVSLAGYGAWLRSRGAENSRHTWEHEFVSLGFEAPASWSADEVVNRLARLQGEHAEQRDRVIRRALAEKRRSALEYAERSEREVRASLESLCASSGLPPELSTLAVTEIASLLIERTRASGELSRAQALRLEATAAFGRELDLATKILESHREETAIDATDLLRRRESLASRERARDHAETRLAVATEDRQRFEAQLGRRRAQWCSLFQELDLVEADEASLARLLEVHAAWVDVQEKIESTDAVVKTLEARLTDHPELHYLSVEEARRTLEETTDLAARHERLTAEIARVEAEVKQARGGHDLEESIAAESQAREALEEVRTELLESAAADFLVDSIASEHRSLAQPDILRRAAERLGEFTRHRYRLVAPRTAPENGPGFEIHETDGGEKALHELSSGTLSQLCLALRLAVAESLERDEELPIFLDEALTNSDPVRFKEIALSLGELVRGGRQLFFLTADPDDAARLELFLAELEFDPPRRFDLAELRGDDAAAPSLEHPPLAESPEPLPGEDPTA